MEDVQILIKQVDVVLDKKLKNLNDLEKEKNDLMDKYQKAKPKERENLEEIMKISEEKFKTLCDEVVLISEKVKKLKKYYN